MTDIFISYARPTEKQAQFAADALRAAGYNVWRDDELPAHRAYSDVIEERIKSAKAVLVLWSSDAIKSQWVRAEADAAREAGTLVQVSLDGVIPPMPFNQIQCADLFGWNGATNEAGWRKVEASIAALAGGGVRAEEKEEPSQPQRRVVVCVVPFFNMSGDAEQEYFSDGISEDIITDLSKVSALAIIGRNAAFSLKGKTLETGALARDLGVTHALEGSVRKAGDRVRISAQLTDCATGHQLWAERYDRDLTDIFAIQDEISKAIVAALQLTLLPKEKRAIEDRGTISSEAYNLYLLARQQWIMGNFGDTRRDEIVVRVARQATALDPNYARAWALMALAQSSLRFRHGLDVDAMTATEKALAINPNIAEVYCVRARYFATEGRQDEANKELAIALRLDPESWEVNKETAQLVFRQGRTVDAIRHYEKALSIVENDYHAAAMLVTCYSALGDRANAVRAAELAVTTAEKAVAQDPGNGHALSLGAASLAVAGDVVRAKEWIARALLVDPDNVAMRYNLACALAAYVGDKNGALDLLDEYFEKVSVGELRHAAADPDMDSLRDLPRFKEGFAAAEKRLGVKVLDA